MQWKKLLNNLTKLWAVSVKRHLFLNSASDRDTVELHGFCDSSSEAIVPTQEKKDLGS